MWRIASTVRSRTVLAALALASSACATTGPTDRWVGFPPGVDGSPTENAEPAPTTAAAAVTGLARGPASDLAFGACDQRREGDSCSLRGRGASYDGACKLERSDLGMGRLECEPGTPKRVSDISDDEKR